MPQKRNQHCTICIHPRLHVTLIGMNSAGYRRNGGAGFCIKEPSALISVALASSFSLDDTRPHPLQPLEQSRLIDSASKFTKKPVRVEISGDMPSHYGFGSATGIRLATLEAICIVTGQQCGRDALVRTSGRGGTSGIGITTYFEGGLIVDIGVKEGGSEILPSSALEGVGHMPLVVSRVSLPEWKVGLCIPSDIKPLTETEEIGFFQRVCPITQLAVNETLYHVIYGLLAGALEGDLDTFSLAIQRLQNCTWKLSERNLHGARLMELETTIYKAGAAAVGLSSIGPCLFFLGHDIEMVVAKLQKQKPEHIWKVSTVWNYGRTLQGP